MSGKLYIPGTKIETKRIYKVDSPNKIIADWGTDFLNTRQLYQKYKIKTDIKNKSYENIMKNLNYAKLINNIDKLRKEKNEIKNNKDYKGRRTEKLINTQINELNEAFNLTVNMLNNYNKYLKDEAKQKNIKFSTNIEDKKIRKSFKELYNRNKKLFYNDITNEEEFKGDQKNFYKRFRINTIDTIDLLTGNINKLSFVPLLKQIRSELETHRYKYNINIKYYLYNNDFTEKELRPYTLGPIPVDLSTNLYKSFADKLSDFKKFMGEKYNSREYDLDDVQIDFFTMDGVEGRKYIKYTGKRTRSIINPQNFDDDKCFYYAVAIGLIKNKLKRMKEDKIEKLKNEIKNEKKLYKRIIEIEDEFKKKEKDLQRISKINSLLNELKINIDDTMLNYPVSIINNEKMIKQFEKANNISLMIYIENENKEDIMLGYYTRNENKERINLLLITDKDGDNIITDKDKSNNEKDFDENGYEIIEDEDEDYKLIKNNNYHYVYLKTRGILNDKKDHHNNNYHCIKCNQTLRFESLEIHYKNCVNPNYELSKDKYKEIYEEAEKLKFKNNFEKSKYIQMQLRHKEDYRKMIDYYKSGIIKEDYICNYCQNKFTNKEALEFHKIMSCAAKEEPKRLIFKNGYVKFENHLRKFKMDTFIISDFESVLKPIEEKEYEDKDKTIEKNTQKIYNHKPLSYCLYLHSDKYLKPQLIIYNGKNENDTMKHFYKDLFGISHYYKSFMKKHNITIDEIDENLKKEFINNHIEDNKCYICGEEFDYNDNKLKPVLDHDHITGELLGIAHSNCNGKRKREQDYIPIYFYNGVGYDYHFIIYYSNLMNNDIFEEILRINTDNQEEYFKELENIDVDNIDIGNIYDTEYVDEKEYKLKLEDLISKNSEKYLSFSLNVENGFEEFKKIKALDYFQMKTIGSLEKHVETLREQELRDNKIYFKTMRSYFKENAELLLQKNLLPYKYFDNYEKTNNSIEDLMNENIYEKEEKFTKEKLEILKKVVKTFNVKKTIEYYNIYLKCDVLQLTDIILTDREVFYKEYGLDLCYYVGAPSYSWDAFLLSKKNNENDEDNIINIEKIKDTNQYTFFRHGMRGGQSYICTRYAKANNIYIDEYDENKEYTYIDYFDMTNLYGGAMKLPLPYKDFELINNEDINKYNENIDNLWADYPSYNLINPRDKIDINKDYNGCWLCVDLKYEENMHDYFYDYPLAPEHFKITKDILSDFSKNLVNRMNKKQIKQTLLTQTLYEKKYYYIYYKTLYLYQSLGMKITKIHYGYKFKERALMRNFIMKNTKLRNEAKLIQNEVLISLYKLMNNAVYGKTMENEQKYSDTVIINDIEKLPKYVSLPTFKNGIPINEESFLIERLGTKTEINKPIYLGATICELAKLLMYNFYYRNLVPEFGRENVKLLFTDTDSLCVLLTSKNEEDRKQHYKNLIKRKALDCSTYKKPENKEFVELSKEYGNINEIGTMKCEEGDKILKEFVGLRSKMYSILFKINEEEDNKCEEYYEIFDEEKYKKNEEIKCKGINNKTKEELRFNYYKYILFNSIDKLNKENLTLIKNVDNIRSKQQEIFNYSSKKIALSADDTKRYVLDDGINTLPYGHYKSIN